MNILGTEFERGIVAGACLLAAIWAPFTEVANGKWVITGICGFVFLVLVFIHAWVEVEAEDNTKQSTHKG